MKIKGIDTERTRRVYIVGQYQKPFIEMFLKRPGYRGTLNLADADICVFTGGPDIDPQLYGQTPIPEINTLSPVRDQEDLEAWAGSSHCLRVGICRGAQFLNVMNGGSLWQHVDNHGSPHFVEDIETNQKIWVTSTHHQQMIPGPDAVKIAVAYCSTWKKNSVTEWKKQRLDLGDPNRQDWEVLWYQDTLSFCFQPHPEHLAAQGAMRDYFFQKLGTAQTMHDLERSKAS